MKTKTKITIAAIVALFATTAGVIYWNKAHREPTNDESVAQMEVLEGSTGSSASSESVVAPSNDDSDTYETEPLFDEGANDDPLWEWNETIYALLASSDSTFSSNIEMIQAHVIKESLIADTSSISSLYETSTAIETAEAVPGDVCFFKENDNIIDAGIMAGHNSVYVVKDGMITSTLISELCNDFEFKRIYDASNVDEDYLKTAASEAGYISLTLDFQTENGEEDAALFDNDTEGLVKFSQDYISGLSYVNRPEVLYVAAIDDTRFQNICEITVVPDNGVGYFVVRYRSDVKTFELVD